MSNGGAATTKAWPHKRSPGAAVSDSGASGVGEVLAVGTFGKKPGSYAVTVFHEREAEGRIRGGGPYPFLPQNRNLIRHHDPRGDIVTSGPPLPGIALLPLSRATLMPRVVAWGRER